MAKRKKIDNDTEAAADLKRTPELSATTTGDGSKLPAIESPPVSPGSESPAAISVEADASVEPEATQAAEPTDPAALPGGARLPFKLNARRRRTAMLAATVVLAAGFGAVIGAAGSGRFAPASTADIAGIEGRKATEQSIAQLSKEISVLKANIAAANQGARNQIVKIDQISDKVAEHLDHAKSPETTGSIPTPRPAPGASAAQGPGPRPPVVKDWTIRDTRGGSIYVQGHGDIYQVAPGAPLPGLGPVQSIKRQDGRWVVITPKGIIVSMRDRRHFE